MKHYIEQMSCEDVEEREKVFFIIGDGNRYNCKKNYINIFQWQRKKERELHLLGTDTCYGKINDLLPWRVGHRESCEVLCVNQCFELTLPWTVNRLDIIMITDSK